MRRVQCKKEIIVVALSLVACRLCDWLTNWLVVGLVGYQKPLIVLQILVQRNNNNYNITYMHAFTKHKTSATREWDDDSVAVKAQ